MRLDSHRPLATGPWVSWPAIHLITILLVLSTSAVAAVLLTRSTSPWLCEATLGTHGGEGTIVALSEHTKTGASAGPDGRVIVWDLVTRTGVATLEAQPTGPTALALAPNSRLLAVAYRNAPVRIWPFAERAAVVLLGEETSGATGLAVSHSGDFVAVCGPDNALSVWSIASGRRISAAKTDTASEQCARILFTPNDWAVLHIPLYDDGTTGSGRFTETSTGTSLRALGSYTTGPIKEFALAGRLAACQMPEFDMVLTDGKGREEPFCGTVVVPAGIERHVPQWGCDAGTRVVCDPPDHPSALAFADGDILIASPNGSVVLARPPHEGEWKRGFLPWVLLTLGLVLIVWLVLLVRLRRRGPASAPDAAAQPVLESGPTAPRLPLSLRILAYLLVVWGIGTLSETVLGLFSEHLDLNLTILNIFAGLGLLRLRRGWRVFVLVELWLLFIFAGGLAGVLLADGPPPRWEFLWRYSGLLPPAIGWIIVLATLAVAGWAYWVLTRPETRALFLRAAAARRPGEAGRPLSVER